MSTEERLAMVRKAMALMLVSVGLAAPVYADTTDDAFMTNLGTTGVNYGSRDKAIEVAKTVVCGALDIDHNTSNADLVSKVVTATSWSTLNAAYFTGAAIQAYCPQYGSISAPTMPQKAPSSQAPWPSKSSKPPVQSAAYVRS